MIVIELAVKVSAIVGVAGLAAWIMRRRASAASRHVLWTLAIVALLLLPVCSIVMPRWDVPPLRSTSVIIPATPLDLFTQPPRLERAPVEAYAAPAAPVPWLAWV